MLLRVADFIFALRPLILLPAWSFYVLGAHSTGQGDAARTALLHPGFWCMTLILASAYAINQIFDIESDRLNGKGFHLTRGVLRVRVMVLLAFAAFVGAAMLYPKARPGQMGLLLATMLLSFSYSLPPLRWCARPWADLLANAAGYGGLAFVIGAGAFTRAILPAWADALPWMLLVGATFLHTTLLDLEGDSASGKRTTSVAIGVRGSARVAAGLAAGSVATSLQGFLNGNPLSSMFVPASAFAVFLWAAIQIQQSERGSEDLRMAARARASSLAVQIVTALVAIFAAWRDPWFLALVIPVVIAARIYYRARFEISYPG